MDELESTLSELRRLSCEPGFQSFAERYMKERRIYGNDAPIYENATKIYDPVASALRIFHDERPDDFRVISRTLQLVKENKTAMAAGLAMSVPALWDSIEDIDGTPLSYAKPLVVTFFSLLAGYLQGRKTE